MAEKKRGPGRPPGSKNKTTKTTSSAKKTSAKGTSKAKEKAKEIQAQKKADRRVIDEIWAIIAIALGVFLIIATFTEGAGQFGELIDNFLKGLFGFVAYILPFYLIIFGILLFSKRTVSISFKTTALVFVLLLMIATMNSVHFIVPEKINGHPVAYIGEFAFERNLRITKVVLPDTVLYLDSGAFSQCLFLKEIDLGESLACLYGNTFYYCRFMKKIKLPDTLLYIGVFAFQSCTSLSEVEGGNALKFISRKTFIVVPSLDKLRLPKDIVIEHEDSIAPNVKVEYY